MARLRQMSCELGLLERADGSARLVQGDTSVLCAVYGPAEVKMVKENCDRAILDVVVVLPSGNSGTWERQLENIISSTCKACILTSLYPHTAISITFQVVHNGGALLSVLMNACCLALMDACIPLSSTISALTCGMTKEGELLVDPDLQQEAASHSLCTCVVEGKSRSLLASYSEGEFTINKLLEAVAAAKEFSEKIVSFYRESITRKFSKDAKFAELSLEQTSAME